MTQPSRIFLDTSVLIALVAYGRAVRSKIRGHLTSFEEIATCDVALQEWKRRYLFDVHYALGLLRKTGSVAESIHWANEVLTHYHARKKSVVLSILATVSANVANVPNAKRALESAVVSLETQLELGVDLIADHLTKVDYATECACARLKIEYDDDQGKYYLPETKCSQVGSACGVVRFLVDQLANLDAVIQMESGLDPSEKTPELSAAAAFSSICKKDNCVAARSSDPCLTLGDLLIALAAKASGPWTFFTKNHKESGPLCKALGMPLHVLENHPDKPIRVIDQA